MKTYFEIKGIEQVVKNIEKEVAHVEKASDETFRAVGVMLRKSMDTVSPIIPVEQGNLRKSWFVVTNKSVEGKSRNFVGKYASRLSDIHKQEIQKAKSYVKNYQKRKGMSAIMGFTVPYAIIVHENLNPKINFTRPGSGAKFLQAALERNQQAIINLLRDNINSKNNSSSSSTSTNEE